MKKQNKGDINPKHQAKLENIKHPQGTPFQSSMSPEFPQPDMAQ